MAGLQECMEAGIHLTSCDDDGYCNACGYQDNPSQEEVSEETVLAEIPVNIDWSLLAQQKAWLAEIPDTLDPQGFTNGLLTFIDAIQDAYATRLGEATVFPHLEEYRNQ